MNFSFVGNLRMPKESDKFKPYSETDYESGYSSKRLRFNMACGDNSHLLSLNAIYKKDGSNDIYLISKPKAEGEKGETYTVKFKDRKDKKNIEKCAEFRKFILDLDVQRRRYLLKDAIDNGNDISSEDRARFNIPEGSDLNELYEKSCAKRYEFLSEYDLIDALMKVMKSEVYKDKKFAVRGSGEYSYNSEKGTTYENLISTRIYLAADDATPACNCNIKLLLDSSSLDDEDFDETGRILLHGYSVERDTGSSRADFLPVPKTLVIDLNGDEKKEAKAKYFKKRFSIEGQSVVECGFDCQMLNGAQRVAISEDDLSDDDKELIELGFETLESLAKKLGNEVYSDRIQELRFVGFGRGYTSGNENTSYEKDDLVVKFKESEDVNPFGDDDDLDI